MSTSHCDFSPMKEQITEDLQNMIADLQQSLDLVNREDFCILCKLEEIKEKFHKVETQAGSFYLNCYLANYTDKYEELSLSLRSMSLRRHGALIVIERKDSLDPIIQKGTAIGALLSPALLESIFYPGNPLHDGAVLVRKDIIVSAANFLPLTNTEIVGKKMGSRHRAALGLSELTDALVLVVSEETGKISFALDGTLYPINT